MNTQALTRKVTIIHHYTPICKLGFPDGVRCWCGTELTFKPHEHNLDRKRRAFFDKHDWCEVPKV